MKLPSRKGPAEGPQPQRHEGGAHPWVAATFIFAGIGILAVAAFWIKKCKSGSPKHEYSALRLDSGEKGKYERELRDGMYTACSQYLAGNSRYELRTHLGSIGSRIDKHWFVVRDRDLDAERLLTLVALPPACPIEPSELSKDSVLALFRGLQHPYIHPVLDVEFWDGGASVALVAPLNPSGSLRDLIYGCAWHEDYHYKYHARGEGLPLKQIQCLGRQILEALLFLRDRRFPPFHHLTAANVIVQNGVARLAALENPLLGLRPRRLLPETAAFGRVLYEMAVGREPSATFAESFDFRFRSTREVASPRVAEVLALALRAGRAPSVEEVLACELFRGVELRELRGAAAAYGGGAMPARVVELLEAVRRGAPEAAAASTGEAARSKETPFPSKERRRLEDIIEEDGEDCSESISIDISPVR